MIVTFYFEVERYLEGRCTTLLSYIKVT